VATLIREDPGVTMTKRFSSELERPTAEAVAAKRGWDGGSEPLSVRRCPRILSPRFSVIPAIVPLPNKSRRLPWEIVAIWSLVVFSFAALLLCFYLIQAKCNGNWPFQNSPRTILRNPPQ
jgi:hypothetical protein